MNLFSIKDIENLSGIKAHTWRVWESRYQILQPKRTATNIRYYDNEELKLLLNIALLNKYGFKISEIDRMSPAQILEKIVSLNQLEAEQEKRINELIGYMADVDMEAFEAVVDDCIARKGLMNTSTRVLFPFLEKIGRLWLTNHINPAQEHMVSNIIRHKFIVETDRLKPILKTGKTILFYLPEGEYHELGLLFITYLSKSMGIQPVYAGANVTLESLAYLVKNAAPDYIYTHLTTGGKNFHFEKYLEQVHSHCGNIPLVVSGYFSQHFEGKLPEHIVLKKSLSASIEFISTLR
ncbi:MAG: MerR family transcriptional regulator [Bacteroidetes bacterium]|nr:MerR family transcriptional regulator [Bacteroidota bacterium]